MWRLSKPAAMLGAAAVLLAGGGAYALASSSDGKITACVKHRGGVLYRARKCQRHDRKISWNKVGREGPAGPAGPTGPAGPASQYVQAASEATLVGGNFLGFGKDATEANVQMPVLVAGHITALYCAVSVSADGGHADTFTLDINGAAQTATCVATNPNTRGSTTGLSIAVAAGDKIDFHFTTTSGGGGATPSATVWAAVGP